MNQKQTSEEKDSLKPKAILRAKMWRDEYKIIATQFLIKIWKQWHPDNESSILICYNENERLYCAEENATQSAINIKMLVDFVDDNVESGNEKGKECEETQEAMVLLASQTAQRIEQAANFITYFIRLGNPNSKYEKVFDYGAKLCWCKMCPDWFQKSLCPAIQPDIDTLRNWIFVYRHQYSTEFDSRVYSAWEEHCNLMVEKADFENPPHWPDAWKYPETMQKMSDFLKILSNAIANPEEMKNPYKPLPELCKMVGVEYATGNDKPTREQEILASLRAAKGKEKRIGEIAGKNSGKIAQEYRDLLAEWKGRGIVDRSGNRGPWRLAKKCLAKSDDR